MTKSNTKKLITVFMIGAVIGFAVCCVFKFCCNGSTCGLFPGDINTEDQDDCIPMCLLLVFIDEEGDRVPDVSFVLTNRTGGVVCSGVSNAMGEYRCTQNLFGCGDEPLNIHVEYSYVETGGIFYYEADGVLLGSGDACSLDPTWGCCRVLVEVETG